MSPDDIELDAVIELGANHLSANLDDDLVLLNLSTARYHVVGGAGNRIMALISRPISVRELCDRLMEQCDVTADTCQREVLDFVRELVRQGIAAARP